MYLFDSSAVIDWLYNKKLGNRIDSRVSISVLSLAELFPAARKKGKKTLTVLEEFLNDVDKIPISESIAKVGADIRYKLAKKGKEKMLFDILIASTAYNKKLTLITLDTDFDDIGRVLDYSYEVVNPK